MTKSSRSTRPLKLKLKKIVSGGQTGVDRAALDVAIQLGIRHGGWVPLGRLAEDGRISAIYDLQEMESPKYSDRTRQNVIDSDATLILYQTSLRGGTKLTSILAMELSKPTMLVRLDHRPRATDVVDWIVAEQIRTLNVAGPRASSDSEIYAKAKTFLTRVFTNCLPSSPGDE